VKESKENELLITIPITIELDETALRTLIGAYWKPDFRGADINPSDSSEECNGRVESDS
jgi:hypothetical protein